MADVANPIHVAMKLRHEWGTLRFCGGPVKQTPYGNDKRRGLATLRPSV